MLIPFYFAVSISSWASLEIKFHQVDFTGSNIKDIVITYQRSLNTCIEP